MIHEVVSPQSAKGYSAKPPQLMLNSKGELRTQAGHIPRIPAFANMNVVVMTHNHYQDLLNRLWEQHELINCA
jgi:hypothetical protein